MEQDPKLKNSLEDELRKDSEARYMSFPEGSKDNSWYNEMNKHYQAREKAETELMQYKAEHLGVDSHEEEPDFEIGNQQ